MGLLTDRITNKSEKRNLISAHEPSHEPEYFRKRCSSKEVKIADNNSLPVTRKTI